MTVDQRRKLVFVMVPDDHKSTIIKLPNGFTDKIEIEITRTDADYRPRRSPSRPRQTTHELDRWVVRNPKYHQPWRSFNRCSRSATPRRQHYTQQVRSPTRSFSGPDCNYCRRCPSGRPTRQGEFRPQNMRPTTRSLSAGPGTHWTSRVRQYSGPALHNTNQRRSLSSSRRTPTMRSSDRRSLSRSTSNWRTPTQRQRPTSPPARRSSANGDWWRRRSHTPPPSRASSTGNRVLFTNRPSGVTRAPIRCGIHCKCPLCEAMYRSMWYSLPHCACHICAPAFKGRFLPFSKEHCKCPSCYSTLCHEYHNVQFCKCHNCAPTQHLKVLIEAKSKAFYSQAKAANPGASNCPCYQCRSGKTYRLATNSTDPWVAPKPILVNKNKSGEVILTNQQMTTLIVDPSATPTASSPTADPTVSLEAEYYLSPIASPKAQSDPRVSPVADFNPTPMASSSAPTKDRDGCASHGGVDYCSCKKCSPTTSTQEERDACSSHGGVDYCDCRKCSPPTATMKAIHLLTQMEEEELNIPEVFSNPPGDEVENFVIRNKNSFPIDLEGIIRLLHKYYPKSIQEEFHYSTELPTKYNDVTFNLLGVKHTYSKIEPECKTHTVGNLYFCKICKQHHRNMPKSFDETIGLMNAITMCPSCMFLYIRRLACLKGRFNPFNLWCKFFMTIKELEGRMNSMLNILAERIRSQYTIPQLMALKYKTEIVK